jgi:hypothetical protein
VANKEISNQQSEGRPFHITIGAASVEGIENELRMVRSALTYADKVKLYSFTTSNVLSLFVIWNNPTKEFLEWGEANIINLLPDKQKQKELLEALERYREILKKKRLDRDDLITKMKVERELAQRKKEMKGKYPAITREDDLRGIQQAVKDGLLELHTFKSLDMQEYITKHYAGESTDSPSIVEEFTSVLKEAMENRATYPLFDDTSGNLVKGGILDGAISSSKIRLRQANHSALAANLLQRLPDFSSTPIDALLDIRNELRPSLSRFRSGIVSYSKEIQSAPWDKDFAAEADEIFIEKVKPGIDEIEEMISSNKPILDCIMQGLTNSKSLLGGTLGLVVDNQVSLPKYITIGLGYTLPTAYSLWQEFKNRFVGTKEAQKHNLYFYYRLRDKVQGNE